MSPSGYVTLIGAEEVSNAARSMSASASEMKQAAGMIEYALQQQRQFMDDWLMRFEEVMDHRVEKAEDKQP